MDAALRRKRKVIASVRGKILQKNPPQIVVECGGIGYEIDVPMSTFYNLPDIGEEVFLSTVMIVREDAQLLYGFLTAQEKELFKLLMKVSGIGPRISLAVLSSMSAEDIGNAIANGEVGLLTKIPGIGKKTAERMVLELKDKVLVTAVSSPVSNVQSEIIQALTALGFSDREARLAAKQVPADVDASEGIRLCLRQLAQKG
nr:Holliday junction branch migration protein RuvA [Parasutterella muris]